MRLRRWTWAKRACTGAAVAAAAGLGNEVADAAVAAAAAVAAVAGCYTEILSRSRTGRGSGADALEVAVPLGWVWASAVAVQPGIWRLLLALGREEGGEGIQKAIVVVGLTGDVFSWCGRSRGVWWERFWHRSCRSRFFRQPDFGKLPERNQR